MPAILRPLCAILLVAPLVGGLAIAEEGLLTVDTSKRLVYVQTDIWEEPDKDQVVMNKREVVLTCPGQVPKQDTPYPPDVVSVPPPVVEEGAEVDPFSFLDVDIQDLADFEGHVLLVDGEPRLLVREQDGWLQVFESQYGFFLQTVSVPADVADGDTWLSGQAYLSCGFGGMLSQARATAEQVTTEAGTYEALRIEQAHTPTRLWLAPKVGIVKWETQRWDPDRGRQVRRILELARVEESGY